MELVLKLTHGFVSTEYLRVATTFVVLLLCAFSYHLWVRVIERSRITAAPDAKRARLVWVKNFLWGVALVSTGGIWASKIAGVALSLAAVAGASMLVSKDLIMSFLGYVVIGMSRPYRVGDYIELDGQSGRVIDIDVFSTTLVETGSTHQLTGKTVSFPNGKLLMSSVRNLSATGEYVVVLYKIILPYDCDFGKAEAAALGAAEEATAQWREVADRHLERIEAADFIDLPSSRPKVLWEPIDSRTHGLTIRFACRQEARATTEQVVFRKFWEAYRPRASL